MEKLKYSQRLARKCPRVMTLFFLFRLVCSVKWVVRQADIKPYQGYNMIEEGKDTISIRKPVNAAKT